MQLRLLLAQGFRDLDESLALIERSLIVVLMLGLVVLGAGEIVVRFLDISRLSGIPDYAGVVLLWLIMLGAARAAAHSAVVAALPLLLAAAVSALLGWAALRLWFFDLQLGSSWAPGLSGSVVLAPLPLCFALMAGRFLGRALLPRQPAYQEAQE